MTNFGINGKFWEKWQILAKMANFGINSKFWEKWQILAKMANFGINSRFKSWQYRSIFDINGKLCKKWHFFQSRRFCENGKFSQKWTNLNFFIFFLLDLESTSKSEDEEEKTESDLKTLKSLFPPYNLKFSRLKTIAVALIPLHLFPELCQFFFIVKI